MTIFPLSFELTTNAMAVPNAFLIFLISFSVIMGWLMMRDPAPIGVTDNKTDRRQKTTSTPEVKSPITQTSITSEQQTLISKKMEETVLPIIDLEGTTLEEALEFIRLRAIDLSSDKEIGPSLEFIISPETEKDSHQPIQFYAEDISISEALDSICDQVHCTWLIKDGSVTIYPL